MVKQGNQIGGEERKVKQEVEGSGDGGGESRVWTLQELCKHPSARGYSRDLYNFAWARAVQKKPVEEASVLSNELISDDGGVVKIEEGGVESEGLGIGDGGERAVSEKEDGELEEGEIDADIVMETGLVVRSDEADEGQEKEEDVSNAEVDSEMEIDCEQIDPMDFDERMLEILDALESVTTAKVEGSFEGVCTELLHTLKSLRELVSVPAMDALVQLFLTAVETVKSVFCSMNQDQKQQHREFFLRLLSKIKSQRPHIFSVEQIKHIQEIMQLTAGSNSSEVSNGEKEKTFTTEVKLSDSKVSVKENTDTTQFSKKPVCDSSANGHSLSNDPMALPNTFKISTSKNKGMAPLLDLQKDHDVDSLPSPTSNSTPDFSNHISSPVGNRVSHQELGSNKASLGTPSAVTHSFPTEALKAFSSYQQTFGGYDELPSPTPSEDNDNIDNDCRGDVSSSFSPPNCVNTALSHTTSTISSASISVVHRPGTAVWSSGINTTITNPTRNRDPRLRYAGSLNAEKRPHVVENNPAGVDPTGGRAVHQSWVNRRVEGLNLDGPASKRQKNELSNTSYMREKNSSAGTGGWLDDNDTSRTILPNKNQTSSISNRLRDPRIGVSGYSNAPVMPDSKTTPLINSLPHFLPSELLENIAVNPTILYELLKNGGQQNLLGMPLQKFNDSATQIKNSSVSDSVRQTVASISGSSPQQQPPSMMGTPADKGAIRMKPRDPRRVLLTGKLQSAESKKNVNVLDTEGQANMKPLSSQVAATADSTMRRTENPKNVTNTMASYKLDTNSMVASQIQSATAMDDRKTDACSPSEDVVADLSKSPATWGSVEHLFDGYDDQQRAAIQKERARRLDEQKKMFAERKLCLVLDLDHTLLNSAKFDEIDPVHEELLKKKEEQDRQKPYRHLFRFPHMAMWTKLRPGVWNFLEKASKLFEMHLYTMGNKAYASEMAKILDPKGILFNGRVISKGDDGDIVDGVDRVPKTKDLEGVLGMESSVLIIDDSIRVWPHNKLNLIVVERYIYFPCSRRQFGLPGPSLLEIDHDERHEDGTLSSCLAVIGRLHKNFFSHRDLDGLDVRVMLANEQHNILRGCRIVFSRVFPVGEVSPHFHPLWQTAEQFGATCTNQVDDKVTHVVANSLGTDKVKWAVQNGRYVVHPNWVEASALLYRRAKEQDFAINLWEPNP